MLKVVANNSDSKALLLLHEARLQRETRLQIRKEEIERCIFKFQQTTLLTDQKAAPYQDQKAPKNYCSFNKT